MADPHIAENDPNSTTADDLYAALVRILHEVEAGYWPGIGAHGQAYRAIRRYRNELAGPAPATEKDGGGESA